MGVHGEMLLNNYNEELGKVRDCIQRIHPIGEAKHIGLFECAAAMADIEVEHRRLQESNQAVEDLAMLVRRLARKVELNNPDLAGKAMDYLNRKGLQGSPLRDCTESEEDRSWAISKCPDCGGRGEILATGILYSPGHSGPSCGAFPCDRCGATGKITDEMLKWIEHGKILKKRRLSQFKNLISWAELRGVTLTEWSHIERGMVDNLAIE